MQRKLQEEMVAMQKAAAQLSGAEQARLEKLMKGEEVSWARWSGVLPAFMNFSSAPAFC